MAGYTVCDGRILSRSCNVLYMTIITCGAVLCYDDNFLQYGSTSYWVLVLYGEPSPLVARQLPARRGLSCVEWSGRSCGDEEKLAWACASRARKDGGEEVSRTKPSAYLHRATAGSLAGSWISLISGPASRSLAKELLAFPCLLARWLCCWLEFLADGSG